MITVTNLLYGYAGLCLTLLCLLPAPAAMAQTDLQFSQSDCTVDVDEPAGFPEKILKKEIKNGRLLLEVSMADLCCTTFEGSFAFVDNQLQLRYARSGEDACFCACAYILHYDLPLPKGPIAGITLNDRPLKR